MIKSDSLNSRSKRPDTLWAYLRILARQEGRLTWESDISSKVKGQAKAAIKTLRKRLKQLMGTDVDLFKPYRRVRGYETQFALRDESGTNDDPMTD